MKRVKQQPLPKVRLMAVVTLSGVSAEPILTFPNNKTAAADMSQWGKTSMHPAQNMGRDTMPPQQQKMPTKTDNLQQVAKDLARDTNTEQHRGVARDIAQNDRQSQPEREQRQEHER